MNGWREILLVGLEQTGSPIKYHEIISIFSAVLQSKLESHLSNVHNKSFH